MMALADPNGVVVGCEGAIWPGVRVTPELNQELVAYVWRSLRRLGVAATSLDDATQDVLVLVLGKLHEFEGRSSFKTWVFGIALHVAQRTRSVSVRRDSEALVETFPDTKGPPQEDAMSRREAVQTLHAILDQLDRDQRVVLVMAELEQMSTPEIARLTGLALGTVYSRLRAARREFNAALKRYRARDAWRHG